ncbi:hypothetical protein CsatA_010212 [Cannabis sativa]
MAGYTGSRASEVLGIEADGGTGGPCDAASGSTPDPSGTEAADGSTPDPSETEAGDGSTPDPSGTAGGARGGDGGGGVESLNIRAASARSSNVEASFSVWLRKASCVGCPSSPNTSSSKSTNNGG